MFYILREFRRAHNSDFSRRPAGEPDGDATEADVCGDYLYFRKKVYLCSRERIYAT